MDRKIFSLFSSCVLLLAMAVTAFGQATGGKLSGAVTDTAGAVVPGATVAVTSKATGQTQTTQTTAVGAYHFPNLAVGSYTVRITVNGFETAVREAVITLNQESTVDVALNPGSVTGDIDITASSSSLIQTESSQPGNSYNTRQIQELPIFGNQYALALLSPNAVVQSAGVSGSGGTIGGARPRGNSFNIDGVNNDDPSITGPSTRLIQDAVQEFTLLNNHFNAEFGSVAGGQFNTITKSGTNELHGSLFGYFQNDGLNARPSSGTNQFFRDQRVGGTVGGPIMASKLFYFGSYQYERVKQQSLNSTYLAPTEAGFQQIAALNGASPYVVDLLRNNLALAATATTTQTVLGTAGIPFGNVTLGVPVGSREHLFQANIDHLPNDKDQFRYRFSFERRRAEQPGGGNAKFNNLQAYDSRLFSATWVRSFTPTLVNDMRLAYRRITENYPIKDSGVSNFPNIVVTDLNLNLGPNQVLPQGAPANDSYQIADAVSWIHGSHTFKFGAEMRRQIFTQRFLQLARGYYDYSSFDELLQDQLPGNQDLRGVGSDGFTGNQFKYGFFGQDDWRVTPNLTLNLGLRYEYSTLPRDMATQALNAIASVPGVLEFNQPRTDKNNFAPRVGFAYSPTAPGTIGKWLFGERGQSSIRGNFGMSYYENFYNLVLTSLPPQFQQITDLSGSAAAFGFDPARPFLQNGGIPNQLIPLTDAASARASTGAYIPDQVSPYSMSWMMSYQREVMRNTVLELRYLGTRGRRLPVQLRLNAPVVNPDSLVMPTFLSQPDVSQLAGLPTLGTLMALPGVRVRRLQSEGFSSNLTSYQFAGTSQYDAGSVSLTRQFTRGLAFTGAYTWSATIDDSTVELNSSAINPRRPQDFYNLRADRGRSALDIPHRFALSFSYDVPFFEKLNNGWLKTALGGWQIHGIFQAQSGQPVTVLSGYDSNFNRDTAGDRAIFNPNGVAGISSGITAINAAGQTVAVGNSTAVAYVAVNPNARYIATGPGALATAGRNTFHTNSFNRTDANIIKAFRFGEHGRQFQVGAELFDLFNQQPRTVAGVGAQTAAFATAGNTFFNDYSIGNYAGRAIQLRAKIVF